VLNVTWKSGGVLTWIYLSVFTVGLASSLPTALAPVYLETLGYTGALIGLVNTLGWFSLAMSSLISGRVGDRYGLHIPLLFSIFTWFLAGLLVVFFENPLTAGLSIVLINAGLGFYTPPMVTALSMLVTNEEAGVYFSVYYSSSLAGSLLAAFLAGCIANVHGFKPLFLVMSMLSLVITPLVKIIRSVQFKREEVVKTGISQFTSSFKMFVVGMALHEGGFAAIAPYISLYAYTDLKLNKFLVGLVVSAWNAGLLATQVPWGKVTDRVGAIKVLLLHLILSNLTWVSYPFSPSFNVAVALAFALGVVGSMDLPARRTAISILTPPQLRGTAMGLLDFAVGVAGSAGYVLGGITWHLLGHKAPFILSVILNTAGLPFITRCFLLSRESTPSLGNPSTRLHRC